MAGCQKRPQPIKAGWAKRSKKLTYGKYTNSKTPEKKHEINSCKYTLMLMLQIYLRANKSGNRVTTAAP